MADDSSHSEDQPKEMPVGAARWRSLDRPAILQSEELLQGQVEVLIRHGADLYRLRCTRNGKLILQK